MLDMGTGGGEFLSGVHGLPARTVATRGGRRTCAWPRSASVASTSRLCTTREQLTTSISDGATGDDSRSATPSFDLVHSRHEAYNPNEVRRVLRRDGRFLTQQAGSGGADAGALLGLPLPPESFDRGLAVDRWAKSGSRSSTATAPSRR